MSLAENLSHPLVSALGWTLLNALWQILIIALIWRSALYFARKASAQGLSSTRFCAMFSTPWKKLFLTLPGRNKSKRKKRAVAANATALSLIAKSLTSYPK
ncbi:MAG: hypothetical protein K0B09_01485 [Bacteroidales bacterium]|nr:hypothetical protein [Bacteroidales bacterium]